MNTEYDGKITAKDVLPAAQTRPLWGAIPDSNFYQKGFLPHFCVRGFPICYTLHKNDSTETLHSPRVRWNSDFCGFTLALNHPRLALSSRGYLLTPHDQSDTKGFVSSPLLSSPKDYDKQLSLSTTLALSSLMRFSFSRSTFSDAGGSGSLR